MPERCRRAVGEIVAAAAAARNGASDQTGDETRLRGAGRRGQRFCDGI